MAFDVHGWQSAGYFFKGRHRFRMWIPTPGPGEDVVEEWGIVISERVSPARTVAILNSLPLHLPSRRRQSG